MFFVYIKYLKVVNKFPALFSLVVLSIYNRGNPIKLPLSRLDRLYDVHVTYALLQKSAKPILYLTINSECLW